jgi:uncharacterized tellurite resistance protein B-like protein
MSDDRDDDLTSEFDLLQLKLAFAYHIVQRIVGADDKLARGEVKFLEQRFPAALLARTGFLSPEGTFTEHFQRATSEALIALPSRLNKEEKLGMIDLLFEATLADDEFHASEGKVLVHAARLLDLTTDELDAHLSTRRAQVADIELTTQEWQQGED